MSLRDYRFRPRWWGFALAACGCAAGIALGQWQAGRAAVRRAALAQIEAAARAPAIELRQAPFDAAPLLHRRVAATGEFVAGAPVLLENRFHHGRPGYDVVQALRLGASDLHVLVLRGWVAAPVPLGAAPRIRTPAGIQHVEGLALDRLPRRLQPGADPPCRPGALPCIWQNLSRAKFAAWAGMRVAPLIIEQASAIDDGLDRDWDRVEKGYLRNEMYALQWYSLAALCAVLFVVLSWRRERPSDGSRGA
jgi:surfeit locus 1 family protein